MTYRIVRFFRRAETHRMIIRSGLTFEEAKAHCNDPESSSRTAKGIAGMSKPETAGDWFDGIEEEPPL